jgi:uncharacterized protein
VYTLVLPYSEFNEKVLLPLYGFDSVDAYYDVVDAKRHLPQIRVPVVVINARDDPLIAEASLPTTDEVSTTLNNEHLHLRVQHISVCSAYPK